MRYRGRLAPEVAAALEADPTLGTACAGRGRPVDPERFHDLDLIEREASYGRSGFMLQFMLDTSLSDAEKYPLKTSDFIVMDINPTMAPVKLVWGSGSKQIINDLQSVGLTGDRWHEPMYVSDQFAEYDGVAMFVDPSGRGKDETGVTIVAMLKGLLFLLKSVGFKGGYEDDTLANIAVLAKKYGVKHVRVESNFGDGMYARLLQPVMARIYPCTIDEVRSNVQKEKRIIDTLEPLLNGHKLIVSREVIEDDLQIDEKEYQLFYQLTRITRDRGSLLRDDRLDSLAGACAYWSEFLGADQTNVEELHRQMLLEKDLEVFMGHVHGSGPLGTVTGPVRPSWLNTFGGLRGLGRKT